MHGYKRELVTQLVKGLPLKELTTMPSSSHIVRLSDLSPDQRRGGLAAWLGWLFDGLDSTVYVLVALPLVTSLMPSGTPSMDIQHNIAYIQAAFLVGWALGGAFFGRVGDRFGRSSTMAFSILLYALCTGLSAFVVSWEQLLFFRFLAALGIGGEWAAGSSLVSETWPRSWRPWVSAALQSAYQCGLLLAALASGLLASSPRYVFLVGALPALIVFWVRRAVPEPEEWKSAKGSGEKHPPLSDLFRPPVRRITILSLLICSASLTTTWALIFWFPQQLRHLPDLKNWAPSAVNSYVAQATALVTVAAIFGNFFAALIARRFGYRAATMVMFAGGFLSMRATYGLPHNHVQILYWAIWAHFFVQGVFGLFPMYIPPLFPTLLRTTGAGFCYNMGRIVAALGTIAFGVFAPIGNIGSALVWVAFLYLPALGIAAIIPEPDK